MKTTRTVLLLLFSGMFLSMKCERETADCHWHVWLNNQTDKPVYLQFSYDYPDTSMSFQNPRLEGHSLLIPAYTRKWINTGKCMEVHIENSPGKKMSLFVFDAQLVDTTPWSQVRQNYQVLKRIDYTVDELNNTNLSIDFP